MLREPVKEKRPYKQKEKPILFQSETNPNKNATTHVNLLENGKKRDAAGGDPVGEKKKCSTQEQAKNVLG